MAFGVKPPLSPGLGILFLTKRASKAWRHSMGRWRHLAFSTNDYYGVYGVYGIGVLDRFRSSSTLAHSLARPVFCPFFLLLFAMRVTLRTAVSVPTGFSVSTLILFWSSDWILSVSAVSK